MECFSGEALHHELNAHTIALDFAMAFGNRIAMKASWHLYCILAIVSSGFSVPLVTARTPDTLSLAPSGQWNINYGTDVCQLARVFGTGSDQVLLQLQSYGMTAGFRLTTIGQPFELKGPIMIEDSENPKRRYLGAKEEDERKSKFLYQFGPAGEEQTAYPLAALVQTSGSNDPTPALITDTVGISAKPAPQSAEEKKITRVEPGTPLPEGSAMWLQISVPRGRTVRLMTGSMTQPYAALQACNRDLVQSWGIKVDDPALAPAILPVPQTSPGTWVNSSDFPSSDLRTSTNAIVNFRLMVNEVGRVTACKIQEATQNEKLSQVTCNLMTQRAKFAPAVNAAGRPVPGYYINSVRWVVPQ